MHNRAQLLDDAPLDDLLAILLRQFRRLLAEKAVELTEAEMRALAQQMAAGTAHNGLTEKIRAALLDLVAESAHVLAQWNLTFAQSLHTDMTAIPGWETTAEFLEIANEKGNAELRIAAGAVLLGALGDLQHAPDLLAAVAHDPQEIETITARRVLSRLSGVDPRAPDWSAQVEAWLSR